MRYVGFDGSYGGDLYEAELCALLAARGVPVERRTIRRLGWKRTLPALVGLILRNQHMLLPSPPVLRPFGLPVVTRRAVVVFHHYSTEGRPWYAAALEELDLRALRLLARRRGVRFVTVAEHWSRWLEARGLPVLGTVYNLLDPPAQRLDRAALAARYRLDPRQRWVYLGGAHPRKGAALALAQIPDAARAGRQFVATGSEHVEGAETRWFEDDDLWDFLREAEVVIVNSQFLEGWNRICHQAVLVGAPLLANGIGGMSELLRLAGVPITDFSKPVDLNALDFASVTGDAAALETHIRSTSDATLAKLADALA